MRTRPMLDYADVERLVAAARQEAEAQGWAVAIAVVDEGGHPLALARLDGSAPIGAYIAEEKARTAALGRRASRQYEEMINSGRSAFLSAPVLKATLTGGVPIKIDDWVIGAVGVSGVLPDQDERVALAAIAALEA
ncbi:heme-binding protein [Halotalea alkalilenta]|uniref:GlcG protein n=1 Tax=Halotalea alkalilenta TaxID=376489 RepID=A0A172YCQ1_9GAMM|nr:heme-binding protein [Halotalea alkalilenta]ANF56896.1 hypothetical protein A5892_04950 [Halotalea alkalilenta]